MQAIAIDRQEIEKEFKQAKKDIRKLKGTDIKGNYELCFHDNMISLRVFYTDINGLNQVYNVAM